MHVISNLGIGGAEVSLCSLVEQTARTGIDHVVISLLSHGELRPRLERAGATVIELSGKRGIAGALVLRALGAAVARADPDIVQSWMYHSNTAATAVKGLGYFKCPLVWSIRQSIENPAFDRELTRTLIWLGARLSAYPDGIVYNSTHAAQTHEAIGYSAGRRWIICNGVDCDRFKPRVEARAMLRAQLGVDPDTVIIGRAARYSPMKDFGTLLGAFRKVLNTLPNARLLLVGTDMNVDNQELVSLCREHGCLDQVRFAGRRLDIELIYPGLDVLVSSSSANEGFPNVVAEALASGALVAATSVGDHTLINEGAHRVVPPKDDDALCEAIVSLVGLSPEKVREQSERGRRFVKSNFSMNAFAQKHCDLYRHLISGFSGLPGLIQHSGDHKGCIESAQTIRYGSQKREIR